MSEHDEQQAAAGMRRPGARRRAPDETVDQSSASDAASPAGGPRAPWASPGRGQPYPGEVGAEEARPAAQGPLTTPPPAWPTSPPAVAFGYPYPHPGAGAGPGAPGDAAGGPSWGGPAGYRSPGPYDQATVPGAAVGPYGDSPTYPGAPPYAGPPPYSTAAAFPASPPYAGGPRYPGGTQYHDPPPYAGAPGYPGGTQYHDPPPYAGAPGYPGGTQYHDPPPYAGAPGFSGYGERAGWSGGWQPPPPAPPGYGTWGPAAQPGWAPFTPDAPPKHRGLTIALVAILVAALIGLSAGGLLVRRNATASRLPSIFPTLPKGGGTPTGTGLPAAQAQAVADAVDPSVVDINAKLGYQQAAAAGTGMVLTSDGQVLTNNHVIAGATSLTGTVVGGKTYTITVLGSDPTEDVALVKLDGATGLKPIKIGDPTKLAVGDPIVAVGNAGGLGGAPSVVTGTVSGLDQSVTASDLGGGNTEQLNGLIEINAPLQPGDSGGPLINASSQVVGMNTAASSSSRVEAQASIGFAIPITRAVSIGQQIAAGKGSANIQIGLPGFLGVSIATNNLGATGGAPISGVLPGSPAEKAGLMSGDLITSVNGQTVDSPKSLTTIMQQRHPGDKAVVAWNDSSGKKHTATVTLTTGPAA